MRRYYQLILSDKVSAIMLMLQAPLMLVILALVCPRTCFTDPAIIWQSDTAMFVIVVMATMMGLLNSYREVCKEREIFLREYDAGLDLTAYFTSKIFVLGSICLIQSCILSFGSYLVIDFPTVAPVFTPLLYWFTVFFIMFTAMITGLFISSVLKSSDSAILPVLFVLIIQIVLAGNIIELEGFLKTFSSICISRWGLTALGNVFDRNSIYPEWNYRTYYEDSIWLCYVALLIICIVLIATSILVLKLSLRKKYKSK